MGPVDTSVRTGRSLADRRQRGDIHPRLAQGKITRRGLRDTCGTDLLVLYHHTITTVVTCLAVGEVELKTKLCHVGRVPTLGLDVAVEGGAGPIFEIRVGQLLCVHGRSNHDGSYPNHYTPKKFTHINYYIKISKFLRHKNAHFLSGAKLLLFCQVHNTDYWEKIYDY